MYTNPTLSLDQKICLFYIAYKAYEYIDIDRGAKETKHSRIRIIIVYTFVAFSLKYLLLTFYAALFVRV